jgi:hypothetical protein
VGPGKFCLDRAAEIRTIRRRRFGHAHGFPAYRAGQAKSLH